MLFIRFFKKKARYVYVVCTCTDMHRPASFVCRCMYESKRIGNDQCAEYPHIISIVGVSILGVMLNQHTTCIQLHTFRAQTSFD